MNRKTFFDRYKLAETSKPKHEQLRDAIVAAIEDGFWKDGQRLPTEAELTKVTPFSLGTIQRAIRSLVNEGVVQRKRGLGTFVIPMQKRIGGPWFWQYLNKDESGFETMTTEVVGRKRVSAKEAWNPLLRNAPDADYLQIDRIVNAGEMAFVSRFFVDCRKFPVFAQVPLSKLHGANFGGVIRKVYRIKADTISRTLRCGPLPEFVTKLLKRKQGEMGVCLEIIGQSNSGETIFYNQVYLPPSDMKMFFQHAGL